MIHEGASIEACGEIECTPTYRETWDDFILCLFTVSAMRVYDAAKPVWRMRPKSCDPDGEPASDEKNPSVLQQESGMRREGQAAMSERSQFAQYGNDLGGPK